MLDITNIPPPRVPVIDDRTGLMSREWYRFLLNLFRLSGSGSSDVTLTDLQLAPQSQVDFGDLNDSYDQAQLSYLSEQSNTLQGEIDSLKVCPTSNVESLVNELPLLSIVANNEQAIADLQNKIDTAPAIPQFGTIANYNFNNQAPLNGVLYSSTSSTINTSSSLTFDGNNIGVGITPSTWATLKAVEIGRVGSAISANASNGNLTISANSYFNAGFIYANTGSLAARYTISASTGTHAWFTAPSGTAGNAVTFTQVMTITNAGNIHAVAGTTGMTNGFFYIPAAAGAPTGVPTAISGVVPMYYDTTNEKFYVYNGAWKSVLLT